MKRFFRRRDEDKMRIPPGDPQESDLVLGKEQEIISGDPQQDSAEIITLATARSPLLADIQVSATSATLTCRLEEETRNKYLLELIKEFVADDHPEGVSIKHGIVGKSLPTDQNQSLIIEIKGLYNPPDCGDSNLLNYAFGRLEHIIKNSKKFEQLVATTPVVYLSINGVARKEVVEVGQNASVEVHRPTQAQLKQLSEYSLEP